MEKLLFDVNDMKIKIKKMGNQQNLLRLDCITVEYAYYLLLFMNQLLIIEYNSDYKIYNATIFQSFGLTCRMMSTMKNIIAVWYRDVLILKRKSNGNKNILSHIKVYR